MQHVAQKLIAFLQHYQAFGRSFTLVVTLVSASLSVYCQQLSYYTINEKDNLPSNEVYQLIQDDIGFMYIGCSTGLYKYDGFRFSPISGKNQNGKSISHLLKDASGTIWCQNFSGQIYYVEGDSLRLFQDYSKLNISIPQFTVHGETLWVALPEHLLRIDKTGKEQILPYPENKTWNVTSISASLQEIIYLSVLNVGIVAFDVGRLAYSYLSENVDYQQRCNSGSTNNDVFFLGEKNPVRDYSLLWVKDKEVQLEKRIEANLLGREIYQWRKTTDGFWICSSNGAYFFNDSQLLNMEHHLFEGEDISSVIEDREGNLWFSTLGNGLKVIPSPDLFVVQSNEENKQINHITSTYASEQGEVYYGNLNGDVFKLDQNDQPIILTAKQPGIYRRVNKILPLDQQVFVGRGILSVINSQGDEVIYTTPYIRDMAVLDSLLYIVSSEGVGVFNVQRREFSLLKKLPMRKVTANPKSKEVAFSGNQGVWMYVNGIWKEIVSDGKSIYSTALFFTDHTLWIGTLNNGVIGIENGKRKISISPSQLHGTNVSAFASAGDQLFITTEAGVHILNLKNNSLQFIGKRLHVDYQGINMMSIARDTIYLATQSGFYYFPKFLMEQPDQLPTINLTGIWVNGVRSSLNKELLLQHVENNIRIAFKSISFKSRNTLMYQYRLKGLSDGWTSLNAATDYVNFEALKPGFYQFEVVAVDGDGLLSSPVVASFTIASPFWQRWWFITLIVLVSSGLLSIFFLNRIRSIQQKNLQHTQLVQSQLTALKAQMNPHFMFNALNSIQDLMIQHDLQKSNLYLGKFSQLMRKVLHVSAEEAISLQEELEILELYLDLEKLRFGNEFSYTIQVDAAIMKDEQKIPPLLLQPFVENAIKHGLLHKKGKRELNIFFEKDVNIRCFIIDNGIGRIKAEEIKYRNSMVAPSFATKATEKRIELLNRFSNSTFHFEIIDLYEGQVPAGTKVILTIPT